ncbi:MAG: DUF4912 domain-containing protein [Clostridia bacterium]|nr:DUF4912 domain-containing protein [Clostridia bacterium]
MAKKTKELEPTTKIKPNKAVSNGKITSSATKKVASKKKTTTAKKTATKKDTTKKSTTTAKKSAAKKTSTTKKSTTNKASTTTKKTTTKKASSTTKKTAVKKSSTTTKKVSIIAKKADFQAEYYDLPYMYNKTIVKVLAQTPKMLFIYWEISEEDRNLFKKNYGEDFFNNTKPVLVVYNDTMHYSFEVEIDDFANSWYLHINDANCDYHIELGRKPRSHEVQHQNNSTYIPYYVYVTSSNEMTSPNNSILFNPNLKTIKFRNVKTGEIKEKDIMQFTFITNYGILSIKDLYKFLYPNESFEFENIVLGNTSSGALSSSGMFSSQFK